MPNIITVAIRLTGSQSTLNSLRLAALKPEDTHYTLSVSTSSKHTKLSENLTQITHKGTAFQARWVDETPNQAILAFTCAWEPDITLLKALFAQMAEHDVTVMRVVACEEAAGLSPQPFWAGNAIPNKTTTLSEDDINILMGSGYLAYNPKTRAANLAIADRMATTLDA